jgi:dipeptidyl aminopeptidase/acylaminoacyl peptidase
MSFGFRAAVLWVVLLVTSLTCVAKTPISVGDMLAAESVNDAVFSPDGRMFAFVRGISISDQNTWGYVYNAELVRSRVFVQSRDGSPPKEIANTEDVHYSLARERAWSPNGRELLLIATTRKGYGFAVYDVVSGRVVALPGYLGSVYTPFDWAEDGRIVYFAQSSRVHQYGNSNQMLDSVSARWRGAWEGNTPQVTVSSSSPVFETSEPPEGALMLADPRSGAVQKLAAGNFYSIAVAPDARHIAVVRGAERLPNSLNIHGRRGELQLFELTSGGGGRVLHRYGGIDISANAAAGSSLSWAAGSSLSWSPSGSRLLAVGAPISESPSRTCLYEVDVISGKLRQIADAQLSFVNPSAGDWGTTLQVGWLGERPIAVAAHAVESAEQASRIPEKTETRLEYGETHNLRFDVYAASAGRLQNLTEFSTASVNQFLVPQGADYAMVIADGALWKVVPGKTPMRLSPQHLPAIVDFGTDRRYPEPSAESSYYRSGQQERVALYVDGDNKGKPQYAVLDLQSYRLDSLKVRGRVIAAAPSQRVILSLVDDGWTSSLLLNDGNEHTVLVVNGALKDKAIAPVRPFNFTYQGKNLKGWVVLPPDAGSKTPLPAVVSVYGGTVYGAELPSMARPGFIAPQFSGQLLAAQGYAVVYPSTPLGAGASSDVMSTLAGEVVAAVDALAVKGVVDPKRVGVMGQSFGGYSAAAILANRSDRFRAGIAMAGIYDWIFSYGMLPIGKILIDDGNIYDLGMKAVEDGQMQLKKPFWLSQDAYIRNSPIFRVEDINTPLMFLHGDLDSGVTGLPGAERMYNAMLRAGKTTALVRYWGQGHVAQSASAIRDQWYRITKWFGHYLKNAQMVRKKDSETLSRGAASHYQ